jgi:hypothetical protein
LNWIYVDRNTLEVKYGIRKDAQPNLHGPFDSTRQDHRLTFETWEGFCAVEEEPYLWALYFDRYDDGLRGKVRPGARILELELRRVEKRYARDPSLRQGDQTTAHAATEVERANEGMPISPVVLTVPGAGGDVEPQPLEVSSKEKPELKAEPKAQREPTATTEDRAPEEDQESQGKHVTLTGKNIVFDRTRRIQGDLVLPRRVTPPQSPETRTREPLSPSPMSPLSPTAYGLPESALASPTKLPDPQQISSCLLSTGPEYSTMPPQEEIPKLRLDAKGAFDRRLEQEEDCQSTSTDPRPASVWSTQGEETAGTRSNGTYTPASSVHGDMPAQIVPETSTKLDRTRDDSASPASMAWRSPTAMPTIVEEARETLHPRDTTTPARQAQAALTRSLSQVRAHSPNVDVPSLLMSESDTETAERQALRSPASAAQPRQYRHPYVEDNDQFDLD